MHEPSVQRYDGRHLGTKTHIAILGSCKVGNFVVTLPLLRLIRRRYPAAIIDFWGSEATRDFEEALCGEDERQPLSWRFSWDPKDSVNTLQIIAEAAKARTKKAGQIDLLINCDGFNPLTQTLASWLRPKFVSGGSLNAAGRDLLAWGELPNQRFLADKDWDSQDFIERYKTHFNSNYIAELLCRSAFLNPNKKDLTNINLPSCQPSFKVPDILIHCTTARAAKIWPFKYWHEVINWCQHQSISVGLVGAPPKHQKLEYHAGNEEEQLLDNYPKTLVDLRGCTTLIELAGASKTAKAVISVDAGPMHVAAGVGTHTLAIVGNDKDGDGVSPIRLWLPRTNCLERTISSYSSKKFSQNHFKNDDLEEARRCMLGVEPLQVINWLKRVLS
ncbi:lipopolysaccharide core biosynthesis protein [Prochlorococcus marinus str. MIT 1313]|uniref:glycosyltransferase family 9 protein n=1 Tax=Prochlorococcus TaxID=1218 RepID=UPI0007B38FB4|nr:glycosyltransferase family 9 protein [Prochlorococcus marinus]KZR70232.1 lipopolysaccharide core biosynthesis protein [Prochlorococcus marinus str. MIT 1313]KZR70704.1 lipopolysaccharide core biosynthesis protein [Prochlorococcus marinus str. MIT 1318]